jgi:hypothetical protein
VKFRAKPRSFDAPIRFSDIIGVRLLAVSPRASGRPKEVKTSGREAALQRCGKDLDFDPRALALVISVRFRPCHKLCRIIAAFRP